MLGQTHLLILGLYRSEPNNTIWLSSGSIVHKAKSMALFDRMINKEFDRCDATKESF